MTRIAILGAGSIVQNAHLPAWRQHADAEVACLVDVRAEVAERVARDHGIPAWSADYRAVLADPTIEAIDLCLPHHLHAPVALECLLAGKHLLIEKPIALDLPSALAVVAAAEEAGRLLMVAENWRYAPATVEAERLIRDGAIGAPFLLKAAMEFYLRPAAAGDNWRLRQDHAGGGVLLDSGIHTMSVARLLMGEMVEVAAVRGKQLWSELAPSEDTLALL
ncbi:MAG: Gfo/Idh/MocA family oxidoreductase, partial [Chloroflexia bacterium]|nr:Gfo/Idh/MocA family oxidoreductase [Chloroflexia bacterium]